MKVSEAIISRKSIRDFLSTPVKNELIQSLLEQSSRAPSGGNLQPWRIYIINGDVMTRFLEHEASWLEEQPSQYEIYPENLKEPYRTSRYELGEQMYDLLGIPRDNKSARVEQVMKNFNFFGAPAGLFCFIDKQMGPPQWSDLGMFIQTFMLLARESGIDTCAQEAWSIRNKSVSSFVAAEKESILFCGVAIGYRDPDSRINKLKSERRPFNEWANFVKK
jgi:nitroreductase